nr:hypothetical protein [Mucilaginibacter sp. L294]
MNNKDLILKIAESLIAPIDSNEAMLTIAEMVSVEIGGEICTTDINTALISDKLFSKIKASHVNPVVSTTGVQYDENFVYRPAFWLYLSPTSGLSKAESLAVSWTQNKRTILIPDQGFLATYELMPRYSSELNYWDDLSKPQYEIVVNKPVTLYNFPNQDGAYVKIRRDYLEDYLKLRKKTAVQIFTINHIIDINEDIAHLLNGKKAFEDESGQYSIRLIKQPTKEGKVYLEVIGYRLLLPKSDPVAENAKIPVGHYWKGIDGAVTASQARFQMPFEYAYVSDDVLAKYEGDDDYEIYPNSGSVHYQGQWSVSHCHRVGRNAIQVELKKLYEGTPDEVITYWNRFSIDPTEIKMDEENIAEKAERLTRKFFLFGRILTGILNHLCNLNLMPADLITLNEAWIEETGWTEFPDFQAISNHVSQKIFTRDQFITRCKKLYILLVENLKEKNLRKAALILGFDEKTIKEFRSMKLLELILKYLQVADDSGLNPVQNKEVIQTRIIELTDFKRIQILTALNTLRQLDAHQTGSDAKIKLHKALQTFGLDSNILKKNYASATDHIYDTLTDVFSDLSFWLTTIDLSLS